MPNIEEKSRLLPMTILNSEITSPDTVTSEAIDMKDFDQGYTFMLEFAFSNGANLALSLEDSPDNSNWTTVPASKIVGTIPPIIDDTSNFTINRTILTFGVVSTERFVRAQGVIAGVGAVNAIFTLVGSGVVSVAPSPIAEGVPILIP